jgi:CheY-like chemotaxis protein
VSSCFRDSWSALIAVLPHSPRQLPNWYSYAVLTMALSLHGKSSDMLSASAFLDVSMPRMNGIEVARDLGRHRCETKIVFLTMHQDKEILSSCLAVGGRGYVVKELMNTDLIPAMKEVLAGREFVSRFSPESEAI